MLVCLFPHRKRAPIDYFHETGSVNPTRSNILRVKKTCNYLINKSDAQKRPHATWNSDGKATQATYENTPNPSRPNLSLHMAPKVYPFPYLICACR